MRKFQPFCTLPHQTIEELEMCGSCNYIIDMPIVAHALPEMAKFLLSMDGVQYLLSERFNQDDVEIYFDHQQARGHRKDNLSVNQFMENAQALMVQKSLALGGSSNITTRK